VKQKIDVQSVKCEIYLNESELAMDDKINQENLKHCLIEN
jgi:hypothetical protein